jgi:hypothetical protein
MADDEGRLSIAISGREAFVLYLTLGILEGIRSGACDPDLGTWTVGRPNFWRPLLQAGFDSEVVAVLQEADELSAVAGLCGRPALDAAIDRMIAVIRTRLSVIPEPGWHATWGEETEASQVP